MGKAKSWVGGPYGEYWQCCDNCHHYWDDMETAGCDLGRPLWDEQYLDYLAGFAYIDYKPHLPRLGKCILNEKATTTNVDLVGQSHWYAQAV
jgi:hypothetical protein